jgi:hypothetical protein
MEERSREPKSATGAKVLGSWEAGTLGSWEVRAPYHVRAVDAHRARPQPLRTTRTSPWRRPEQDSLTSTSPGPR